MSLRSVSDRQSLLLAEHRERFGLLQTPERQTQGACTYILVVSYCTRVLECQKNKSRRVARRQIDA